MSTGVSTELIHGEAGGHADADDRGALGAEALSAGECLPSIALTESGVLPWILSAKNEPALRAQAERLRHHLSSAENAPAPSDTDVAFSLTRRSVFEHRTVVLAGEREGFLEGLGAVAAGSPAAGSIGDRPPAAAAAGGLAFLFTGQGAQRAGMGRELYDTFPVFGSALEELCTALDAHLQRPLRDALFASEGSPEALRLDETQYTQAALFALEVALFRLLESFALRPDYVIGHSIGELAAAHVAGVFSLQDACALVSARGRLMGALPAGGAMVSVRAGAQEITETLADYEGQGRSGRDQRSHRGRDFR